VIPDSKFRRQARELEAAYLETDDPQRQSGFSGGRERWVSERSPLVEAIDRDGDFLDVGCANGLLAADVVVWASQRGVAITPHGIDLGASLIELARHRHPGHETNFQVADAWSWAPGPRWRYVYSLLDLSPEELWCDWIERLLSWVEPGGRLILGSYGGRTPPTAPVDVARVIQDCGSTVAGSGAGGEPLLTRFAWTDA